MLSMIVKLSINFGLYKLVNRHLISANLAVQIVSGTFCISQLTISLFYRNLCWHITEKPFQIYSSLSSQWTDRQGSRLWDRIVQNCDQNQLEQIYQSLTIISDDDAEKSSNSGSVISDLALNQFGNFPLQRLIERIGFSEEAVTDLMVRMF